MSIQQNCTGLGKFYEVDGDLKLESTLNVGIVVGPEPRQATKLFLFYLRDQTFECDAESARTLLIELRKRRTYLCARDGTWGTCSPTIQVWLSHS